MGKYIFERDSVILYVIKARVPMMCGFGELFKEQKQGDDASNILNIVMILLFCVVVVVPMFISDNMCFLSFSLCDLLLNTLCFVNLNLLFVNLWICKYSARPQILFVFLCVGSLCGDIIFNTSENLEFLSMK